jgi:DNA-binding LacI/PurR family transcriptional regulator
MSNPAQRRPVIADVARRAGVSVPTVSRVLTGSVPVSEARRTRVLMAIKELGFHPNASARALVSGRRSMIGIIAPNTTRYGYARTLQGVEEAARASGYVVVIVVVESEEPTEIQAAIDLVLGQAVGGVVVIELDPVAVSVSEALPTTIPVVVARDERMRSSSLPHAYVRDRNLAAEATRYLLSLGHRTVHHLAIPSAARGRGRALGWRAALVAAGAPVPDQVDALYDPASGYSAGRKLVEDPDVTAVLCGNDEVAIGLMRALAEAGRSVPGDVSVIGFDDQPFATMWVPSLTTVAQDFDELGRRAFALLDSQIRTGSSAHTSSLSPRLVIRESTAPPRSRGATARS